MCLGIAVHKRYAQAAVMDAAGELLDNLVKRYAGAQAVLEATSNYSCIHELLSNNRNVFYRPIDRNSAYLFRLYRMHTASIPISETSTHENSVHSVPIEYRSI